MSHGPEMRLGSLEAASSSRGRWRPWVLRVALVVLLATACNVCFVVARWYWPDWERWKEPLGKPAYYRTRWYDTHRGVWVWALIEYHGKTRLESWVLFVAPLDINGAFDAVVDGRFDAPRWSLIRDENRHNLIEYERCIEHAYGWPWRCMMARASTYSPPGASAPKPRSSSKASESVIAQLGLQSAHRLTSGEQASLLAPTHIFWPGMLANLLVWSAIVLMPWVLWQGVWWIRRRIRVRHARCPQCRYDVRGLPAAVPCPECGRRIIA